MVLGYLVEQYPVPVMSYIAGCMDMDARRTQISELYYRIPGICKEGFVVAAYLCIYSGIAGAFASKRNQCF